MIVPEIPLTAVGKIFKPALVWREVETVYRHTLLPLEGELKIRDINVGSDKKHGTLARVSLEVVGDQDIDQLTQRVKELLGKLPTRFELLVNR